MIETCSQCGHSYRNHGIDGCYFEYYDKYGKRTGRCPCERNEFDEYDILQKKLDVALEALEKIKKVRGGVIAVDDLGHERDLPNYEGDIAIEALDKIQKIK